jgi:hypothetical protein
MQVIKSRPGQGAALPSVVTPEKLREWVTQIAVPRHPVAHPLANRRIAENIAMDLASMGYKVTFDGSDRNVVALPKKATEPLTIVGAHYDSVVTTPGADDNASGVAALLAAASVCKSPSVAFVAFNREEDGLIGSADFVRRWKPRIAAAHVLEMVGYRSRKPGSQRRPPGLPIPVPDTADFLAILANGDSNRMLDAVIQTAGGIPDLPVIGLKTFQGIEKLVPVLLRSDHASFWSARIPALMWTDTSEFRNPNYHKAGDTPDTLDYEFMADVVRLLVAQLQSAP